MAATRTNGDTNKLHDEAPRKRGRPRIGNPHSIRLAPEEEDTATALAGGTADKDKSFAEGVRIALRHIQFLGRPIQLEPAVVEMLRSLKPNKDLAACIEAVLQGGELPKPQVIARNYLEGELGGSMFAFLKSLGDGNELEGLARALRVAKVMGAPAIKRLDPGENDGHPD
jgi:hypothetical protein